MVSHEDLLGYLIGALEPGEQAEVEQALRDQPELQAELRRLQISIRPLESAKSDFDVPPGLASRTLQYVETERVRPRETGSRAPRFRALDAVATIVASVAIAVMIFPALMNSQFQSRVNTCQANLLQLGSQLINYAEAQPDRSYPPLDAKGNLAFSGSQAVKLADQRLLEPKSEFLVCAGSNLQEQNWQGIPTRQQVLQASGDELMRLQREAGGSYGWYLGVISDGQFGAPRYQGRSFFVILSDSPLPSVPNLTSANHGGIGLNVLFDDQHIEFIKEAMVKNWQDDPLRNHLGFVAAGVGANDSVIARSGTPIRIVTSILLDEPNESK